MKGHQEAREYGLMMEERMRKMFKGKKSYLDEVDFETTRFLYEVKSCKLFTKGNNQNSKRKYVKKPHIDIESYKLGRFQIITNNHIMLYLRSLQTRKTAKYVFVVRFGKQIMFKVLKWEEVLVPNSKDYHYILIKEIFGS